MFTETKAMGRLLRKRGGATARRRRGGGGALLVLPMSGLLVQVLRVSRRRPYPALLSIRKLMDDWGLLSLQTWLHSQTLLEVLCRMEVVLMVECYLLRTWRWARSITYRRGRSLGGCIEVR